MSKISQILTGWNDDMTLLEMILSTLMSIEQLLLGTDEDDATIRHWGPTPWID